MILLGRCGSGTSNTAQNGAWDCLASEGSVQESSSGEAPPGWGCGDYFPGWPELCRHVSPATSEVP